MAWDKLADDKTVEKVAETLRGKGIEVVIAKNGKEALTRLLESIPEGSEMLTATSTTVDQIGGTQELNDSGRFRSQRKAINEASDEKERLRLRKLSAITQYVTGSVHAVTEDGRLVVATASGSQIPPYSYTAEHVVFVVGTQKIVRDLPSALKRIEEYTVPLEEQRMRKNYGIGTSLNQILIINKSMPGRIKLIFVKEKLGF